MTYYGAQELADSFRTVRKNTIRIAEDIPEDKYNFAVAADVRTVEKLLTHIALTTRFQYQIHGVERRSTLEGFNFPALMQQVMAEEAESRTKDEVIGLLRKEGETWANFLSGLPENFLSVKEHEMHHRGQLMLIERMIGLVPHLTREMQARMAQVQAQSAKK